MNYCEECGEKLEVIAAEDAEPTKEECAEEKPAVTQEENELESFINEMCSMENREVLKELISGTGAEWFGKNKDFMKEVVDKFADFKAKKNNQTVY